ncbi:Glyoxalase-like domain-containing protein [Nannocystis exedens]|uniref:Glyoxalase-like domain-containing protein n=1 Tax=Nannocystis exedens TaxID=54 RepID=A0A1I2CY68_9BACT|nr:VOC family protein [Nannocystis exedens]PCC68632.1 glyoxalase/bleomycin resistance protein/dioxygenase [Nannocystis exedens]SFE72733.1 Glyoxalase-like domain-containing protein [Nannocystis exedens]
MAITLNHTIVPARDKVASARFFADIFGLRYDGEVGPFAPVRVNDSLTLDFGDDDGGFEAHHYAFLVDDAEFDAIFARVRAAGLPFASSPHGGFDNQISRYGRDGRRVYFPDPNGHFLELMTRVD